MCVKVLPSGTVEDVVHGRRILDRFRWLEDGRCLRTRSWIRQQQLSHDKYFSQCADMDSIRARVTDYLDQDTYDQPYKVLNQYFFRLRRKGQEQASIYIKGDKDDEVRALVVPTLYGTHTSVGIHRISHDGKLLAYEVKSDGGDKKSIQVLDVPTGRSWTTPMDSGYVRGFVFSHDQSGYFYCQEPLQSLDDHAIRRVAFGACAAEHVIFRVKRTPGSRLVLACDAAHLGAFHIYRVEEHECIDVWIASLAQPSMWERIVSAKRLPYIPLLVHGDVFAIDYSDASDGRVVRLDISARGQQRCFEPLEGSVQQVIAGAGHIATHSVHGTASVLSIWSTTSPYRRDLPVPIGYSARIFPTHTDGATTIFYSVESWGRAQAIYEHNLLNQRTEIWRHSQSNDVGCTFQRIEYRSIDGTAIPLSLVIPSNTVQKQPCPAVLTSYGGFGVSMTPRFSVLFAIMLELGVVLSVAHIRGGGEYGRSWHEAARGHKRTVAFADFRSAAAFLIERGITTPAWLAMVGGSNGGLLVAEAMTARPDLFGAVICIAPLLDMVRYECFDNASRWRSEYGTVEDPEGFASLYSYSPYHRILPDVDYPASLFVTGDSDDRCNPMHVRKMVAALIGRDVQKRSIIMDYTGERGHSPVLPLTTRVEALTRRVAFLCRELNIPFSRGVY